MKSLDIFAAVLLIIGGLNWGLVGLLKLDLVATTLGNGTLLASVVYILVGLAAVYQAAGLRAIQRRWGVLAHQSA